MPSRKRRNISIAWYKRKDYPAIRAIMDDAHVLPVDYDTWLRQADTVVRLELALGSDIVKVTIDPGAFLAWCEATRQRVDGRARSRHVHFAIDTYADSL